MTMRFNWLAVIAIGVALWAVGSSYTWAVQEEDATTEAETEVSAVVDFVRDVYPILEAKCLKCHGPKEAKNDFRVDDRELLLDYLEPGDLEGSSLWTDYLMTDDPDTKMPPPDAPEAEPLTGTELAVLRVWIEDGAVWPEDFDPRAEAADSASIDGGADAEAADQSEDETASQSKWVRIWYFSGLFHPAVVHFPVALLTVSALFVLLSFVNRSSFEPVAYHLLWIGALMAVAACITGWAYAIVEGYGTKISFDWENSAIDRHRWLGIAVAIVSLITFPIARTVRRTGSIVGRVLWLLLGLALAGGVVITGYQGGELVYGEDHYWKAYEKWFGPLAGAAEEESDIGEAETATNGEEEATLGEEDAETEEESPGESNEAAAGTSTPATGIPPRPNQPQLPGASDDATPPREEAPAGEKVNASDPASAPEDSAATPETDANAQGQQEEEEPPAAVIE